MSNEIHQIFLSLPHFHGLIPREDLGFLLRKKGDYLIRCSDVEMKKDNKVETREYIISVNSGEKNKKRFITPNSSVDYNEFRIRHVVIGHDDVPQWYLSTFPKFKTMEDLCAHYKLSDFLCKGGFVVRMANPINRAEWELTHGDIELGRHLGKGEFGEVRIGALTWGSSKVTVAVKLTKGVSELSKMKRNKMMAEARIMRDLVHPNVVRLYGIGVLQQPLYIVLEMVDGGGLDSYLRKNLGNVPTNVMHSIVLDTAAGVEYIHSRKIIHRDLAARNCLITNCQPRPVVKISDFGLSRHGDSYTLMTRAKIPIKWCTPETIRTFVFTPKSDVWAWGVTVYEIFTYGREPWEGKTNTEAKNFIFTGVNLPIPDNCNPTLRDFVIRHVWAYEAHKRPTMSEIVNWLERFSHLRRRSNEQGQEIPFVPDTVKSVYLPQYPTTSPVSTSSTDTTEVVQCRTRGTASTEEPDCQPRRPRTRSTNETRTYEEMEKRSRH